MSRTRPYFWLPTGNDVQHCTTQNLSCHLNLRLSSRPVLLLHEAALLRKPASGTGRETKKGKEREGRVGPMFGTLVRLQAAQVHFCLGSPFLHREIQMKDLLSCSWLHIFFWPTPTSSSIFLSRSVLQLLWGLRGRLDSNALLGAWSPLGAGENAAEWKLPYGSVPRFQGSYSPSWLDWQPVGLWSKPAKIAEAWLQICTFSNLEGLSHEKKSGSAGFSTSSLHSPEMKTVQNRKTNFLSRAKR